MSNYNQWEVVTKSKKQKNFEKKIVAHNEKKKEQSMLPKLEEILPRNQFRNIITGHGFQEEHAADKSNDNSKSKISSPKRNRGSKVSIQQRDPNKKNKSDSNKGQIKIKNLEQAFKYLTADNFASYLEQLKMIYPGSKLTWLKEVANYLNSNLPFECDPIFSGKSVSYPSSLASQSLKQAIMDFLSSQGEINLDYFFHYTLLESMCSELNKNQPVIGYKFLLQLIAQNWPQICSNKMANTAMLRDSYQNRSNICLSLLWAIGQGGYRNLMEGLKVWQNLMLPNLTMKSYCRFITEYVESILNIAIDQRLTINQNQFFTIYNVLKTQHAGLYRECQQSLSRSASLILEKYIVNTSSHANLFVNLLRDNEINGCLSILLRNDDCFKVWKMNYKKQLVPTINLLEILRTEMFSAAAPLAMSQAFHKFLRDAKILNAELSACKRCDSNVNLLIELVQSVQDKTAQQKKKQAADQKKKGCGCCKWMIGSILLVALIAGALLYDTEVNGKGVFAKSATGKFLQNAGVLPHVEKAWYTSMSCAARGYKWAEKNFPPYTKPVFQLVCDVSKLVRNVACNAFTATRDFFNAKLPIAAEFLDQYVPGLPKKIEHTAGTVKMVSLDFYSKSLAFFRTQVLVGYFSPENLSKTFNQTQNLAVEYYNQFHKKVDAYAKLK